MKKALTLLLILSVSIDCNKSSSSTNNDVIKYELKSTGSSFNTIEYLDETASPTTLSNINSSTWSITFTSKTGRPRTLLISGFSTLNTIPQTYPTITANVYVNNTLVKTASNNSSGPTVFLQYTLLP